MQRPDTIHITKLQRAGMGVALAGSIVLPAPTLLVAALWLAIRIASYVRAAVTSAEIVDWDRNVDHRRPEEVLARPILAFTDTGGSRRMFVSSRTFHDAPLPDGGLLPSGEIQVRYRAMPFFAEIDDPRLWFTLPALVAVIAILGLVLNFAFRAPLLRALGF